MSRCVLHTEASGPSGAPVIVFTGSLGTRLSMWEPQVRALGQSFRVVRCDVRGHGGSPVPPGSYALADLGADLVAVLERLDAGRVHLVGLSIGAMMSLWAAAHAPEHVDRLVACCTTARFGPEAVAVYRQRAAAVRAHGLDGLADGVLSRWFTPEFAHACPDVVARVREDLVDTSAEGYAGCCEALAGLDLEPELARITAPTLVISGERDLATPPEHGRAIAAAIEGAEFVAIPAAAHLANLEQPGRVNELLWRFLSPGEPHTAI